ncbi:TetR/AcrR family transcriptional regulator [Sphingomonas sp. LaA6.9]|uniref:TetR/AcrR family transcriptional regulator n=1 Tax=Sphingomonas sp. LaA6.9 TaxID=2919914 RepID=UPI001F4F34CD|nr:TetR/AcrR family transcriptional regulator [Sphingomonas sp. LaA6.9]MCJ8159023.1 TetR/AcrR family transcriptional regulator [Sphingomonas sp. LaA6.9]
MQRTAKRQRAAERICAVARDLFYLRGIRAVSVDDIVTEAGITKPTLYRTFASKDALVAACLEENATEDRAALTRIAALLSPPDAQLLAIVGHYAAKAASPDFRGCALSNTAIELHQPAHPGHIVLEGSKREMRALITRIARQLTSKDPGALADGLILLIEGTMASHQIFGDQGPSTALTVSARALIDSYRPAGHADRQSKVRCQ